MSSGKSGSRQVVPSEDNQSSCEVCQLPDNSRMVACDDCGLWFHFECVAVNESVADRDWSCENCKLSRTQIPGGCSTPYNENSGAIGTIRRSAMNEGAVGGRIVADRQSLDAAAVVGGRGTSDMVIGRTFEAGASSIIDSNIMIADSAAASSAATYNVAANRAAARSVTDNCTADVVGGMNELQQMMAYFTRKLDEQQNQFAMMLQQKEKEHTQTVNQLISRLEKVATVEGTGSSERVVRQASTGAIAKTYSANTGSSNPTVRQQRTSLQASERRQMEERLAVSEQRDGASSADIPARLNPAATEYRPSFYDSEQLPFSSTTNHELSRSQLAARQGLNRDLPVFTGDPEEWPLFYANYLNSTRICGYSSEENMLRLQRSLKGKALAAVKCRLLYAANLDGVISTLKTLFGRPEIVIHSLVNRIRDTPAPKTDKLETLVDFGVAVQNVCATIKASGLDDYLCNVALLQELVDRLPSTIKLNWAMHRLTLGRVTLEDFGDWLQKMVEAACLVTVPTVVQKYTAERRTRKASNFVNVHSEDIVKGHDVSQPKYCNKRCLICNGECEVVEQCSKFKSMSISSRWAELRQRKLCKKCLRKHYGACSVKSSCGVGGCIYMHHKLLHDEKRYKAASYEQENKQQSSTVQSCNAHVEHKGDILFRYIPVVVYGRGVSVKTYAFLDDGSSATLIDQSLLKELKLNGEPHPLCLNWTGGQQRSENESVKLSLKISGTRSGSKMYVLPKVHTVEKLALPYQSVSFSQLSSTYKHLKGLPIESYKDISPRILIGIDNCKIGQTLRSQEGSDVEPIATKTRLGWLVFGPCSSVFQSKGLKSSMYHSYHICLCAEADDRMNAALKEYISIDGAGAPKCTKLLLSKEDERAMKILAEKTVLKEKRYETGLLWKFDNLRLPDSKAMALKRLDCLDKRMARDPDLAEQLRTKILDYEQKGYITKLTAAEANVQHPRTWYLPIFPVTNPNKPGKLRLVWDAAATVKGVSLNSMLLPGPDQLTSLPSVLYRFREYRYGIAADIREMFHQILINDEDKHSQRFLWRADNEQDPAVFVMNVMTFGATCSPSCAQYILNLNAERFQRKFIRAVDCIKNDHYVDDMLTSEEDEADALRLAEEVRFIHAQGGFELRNWLSNSSNVMCKIAQSQETTRNLNLCSPMVTEKVLGMWWNTASDTFTFKLSPKHDHKLLSGQRVPTKREVLRTMMSIYDPLGLIANYIMYLKILFQEVWRAGTEWDDQIPDSLAEKWTQWAKFLPRVEHISIPRCYRLHTSIADNSSIQLHIFVDAGRDGYVAVAYLRFEQAGVIECALVGSKTKVAPLKYISVPRLELQAALVGVRLASSIVSSHRLKVTERHFWTDSRDVLCWLKADYRRYSVFVAHRVGEILECSSVNEWNWISTKQNVADEGTKWQQMPDLEASSRWFRGPQFLWKSKEEWPICRRDPGVTQEDIRSSVLHHSVHQPLIMFKRFSQWRRLLRTIAYVGRFTNNTTCKLKRSSKSLGPLTKDELSWAEKAIFREVQRLEYPEELKLLAASSKKPFSWKRVLPTSSKLYMRCPYLDDDGVLRMRGRIDACSFVDDSVKRPILLPKQNYLTDLLIADFHRRYQHVHHETALNELSKRYSIPRLRASYNRVRNSCQLCKIRNTKPIAPMMGNLPPARLAAYSRPFSYTGIDYFGPMLVVVGRRTEKRWGVLLTCLTIRAVHIELAHSMSTDSCILALRNFIARRGSPVEIISDHGTNFVGASRELKDAVRSLDQNRFMGFFNSPSTKWTFIPPAAPHFGGAWERLVQTVKRVLNKVKPSRTPTDEILRSMLHEVELIVNSRPLTYVPLDKESSEPITPNHLLLGSSDGAKPPIAFNDNPSVLRHSWRMAQAYADEFWSRWIAEYLPTLTRRSKWYHPVKPIEVDDLVLVVDHRFPRNCWPRGRVVGVQRSGDDQVRQVSVQTAHGVFERPATKIAVLDVGSSTGVNRKDVPIH